MRGLLGTSDTRTSGVTSYFTSPFPRYLILSSFFPYLAAMPSHRHLTLQFYHQNPQLSLYRVFVSCLLLCT